ncbi:MAG: SDR family NAD(P)-dependent oxidoreductase [Polyangiaceae bacterium]
MRGASQSRLKGKLVLVTGASRGIGLETAKLLAMRGARVVLAARTVGVLYTEVERLRAMGASASAVELDVTEDDSVSRAMSEIAAREGGLDLVINNAGNGGRLALWGDTTSAAFRQMFEVHVFGAERVARAALPLFDARGGGSLVQVASTVAWVPMPGSAAYSAAKAAVLAWSEVLRAELASSRVSVRVFSPPHTSTEAGRTWQLGLPKIFEPDWVAAEFVRFLEGDDARAIPGGNVGLLWLQRVWPRAAARIMEKLGWDALHRSAAGARDAKLVT